MARDDAATAIHFPIRLLTVALVLTTVAFAWFGWIIFDERRDAKMFQDESLRTEELRGVIVHLDEVLTMSARMAAATGDPKWEERYRRFEPQLDAAIKETTKLGTTLHDSKAAAQTDEANIKLVEMENRAFALVHAGRKEEAQAVVFSPVYEAQTKIYAEGINSFNSQIRRQVDERERRENRIDFLSIFGALVVLVISFAAWLSVMRGLQRWRTDLEQAVSERTQAVRRANAELEVGIEQRTAELGRTNQALQAEITERKRTEEQLRVQATALDAAANAIVITDHNGTIQSVNPAFTALTGYTAPEAVGQNPRILKGGKQDDAFYRNLWQTISSGQVWSGELTNRRKDGGLYAEEMTITPLRNAAGVIARYIAIKQDITGRKQAEEAVRQSEEQLRAMFELASVGIAQADPRTGQWLRVNQKMCEITGYSVGELLQMRVPNITYPEDRQADREAFERVVRGEAPAYRMEKRYIRKDGALAWVNVNMTVIRNAAGQPTRTVAAIEDITERKRAEEALREIEFRLARAMSLAQLVAWEYDVASGLFTFSDSYYALHGTTAELEGGNLMSAEVFARKYLHPDDAHLVADEIGKAVATAVPDYRTQLESRIFRRDGELRYVLVNISITKDAAGRTIQIHGANQDVTERRHLEAQLIQSQKLETVGRLAGGVAHEFNSILTAIIGQSELLLNDLPPGDSLCKNATEIRKAADRAATLTRQLLAYGRKQLLQPEILNLNSVLAGMASTLGHLMGRGADMRIVPASGLKAVKADVGQIEQVIMNMAINAADAMPNGGKLTLETANVTLDQEYVSRFPELKAGEYVMLAITDTGTGMSKEAKARVFEPFFSTKGVGRGTGLGLSTCYGIIKQSGGHISVHSESGRGTAFKIYLPQVEPQTKIPIQRLDSPDLPRGTEAILLVEEDPALREMAATLLGRLGYTVSTAANGVEALNLTHPQGRGHIDLLFTDVAMPHVNGRELSERVRALYPHIRILFTSAYTENAIVHQKMLNQGVALLRKPFTPSALALKVREVLDQPSAPKPGTAQKTFGLMEITGRVNTP
jgi:two-component system cell cycle sensor histidine kinase/response regulator CckA